MSELLRGAAGREMTLPAYYSDFERNFWTCREFWKLERGQVFSEPGNDSWEAFSRGEWGKSMCLLEDRREDLEKYHAEVRDAGVATYRIRIVELPLSPYLQWELRLLRIRDETGGPVRVLTSADVAGLERSGPLPEIYTMDSALMYEAVYDGQGVLEGARRYTGEKLVRDCRDAIRALYARGEPIASFAGREVAPLPPARPPRPGLPADYLKRAGRPEPIRS